MTEHRRLTHLQRENVQSEKLRQLQTVSQPLGLELCSNHCQPPRLHLVEVQSGSLNSVCGCHLSKVLGHPLPAARGWHSDWSLSWGPEGGANSEGGQDWGEVVLESLPHLLITGAGTAAGLCKGEGGIT